MTRTGQDQDAETWPVETAITPVNQLEYVVEMTAELRKIALSAGADTLAHVLEVACLEAELQVKIRSEAVPPKVR